MKKTIKIEIEAQINAPIKKVWDFWTAPKHIKKWNNASDDWHTTRAKNDLKVGGRFLSRMEAKDGSMGFDFEGTYDVIQPNELISYVLDDSRKVKTTFTSLANDKTQITTIFDAENANSGEMQKAGWQAILNNFKKYTES